MKIQSFKDGMESMLCRFVGNGEWAEELNNNNFGEWFELFDKFYKQRKPNNPDTLDEA